MEPQQSSEATVIERGSATSAADPGFGLLDFLGGNVDLGKFPMKSAVWGRVQSIGNGCGL